MDAHELTGSIKRKALELGFVRAGITTPDAFDGYVDAVVARAGYEDLWQASQPGSPFRKMAQPREAVPGVKSIISLVRAFGDVSYPGNLLAYAGRTYLSRSYAPHADTMEGQRVELFERYLAELGVTSLYDHTNMQLIDRAVAARAGVITYGKNNFAYADEYGSFITLVTIPVDAELECEVHEPRRACPVDCRKCVDACPTGAIAEDGALDPRKCVIYSNFVPGEYKHPAIQELIGTRIHGCDACQEACPRNQHALQNATVKDPFLEWLSTEFKLERVLFADDDYYEACIKPVMYNYITDLDIFRQNAAIAMGNSGDKNYLPALERAAETGSEQVRRFATRAIEKLK